MSDAARAELQALLVRAAIAEAARQDARKRGDTVAERALEDEIRQLWARHADLEAAA